MRIAYLIADRHIPVFGQKGASVHIQATVRAMTGLGHDVTVFAARVGREPADYSAKLIEIAPPVQTPITVSATGLEKRAAKEEQALATAASLQEAVLREHRRRPFDFLYERYSLFSMAGVQLGQSLGIPSLLEVNSPLVQEQLTFRSLLDISKAREIEAIVFRQADAVLTVSDQVRDYVLSITGDNELRDRLHVLPNGVDRQRFHPDVPATALPIDPATLVIGFVGSLKPWHGLDVLLRTMKLLRRDKLPVHLLLAGDGPMRDWIEGFIHGAELVEDVTLTGWLDNEALPTWIASMDIAVAPYPAIEGFYFSPLKLFEYLAMGKPVVASDIGQIADIIEHRTNGLLCQPGDEQQLANSLRLLIQAPELQAHLAKQAPKSNSIRSWSDIAARIVDIATNQLTHRRDFS